MFVLTVLRLRNTTFGARPLNTELKKKLVATANDRVSSSTNPQAYNRTPTLEVITSGNLEDYLRKFWIVVFGLHTGPVNIQQMHEVRRHLQWYGGRHRVMILDRHPHARTLVDQIVDWRKREEVAAELELAEKASTPRGSSSSVKRSSSDDENNNAITPQRISKEASKRHLYTRSNLTEFGRLFLSSSPLPAIFVNGHYLGGLDDLQMLEKQRKLKDIVQFGFEWKSNKFLKPMESAHKDGELFKAQYVGAPVLKPVAMLPQVSTRFNVDDPFEGKSFGAPLYGFDR